MSTISATLATALQNSDIIGPLITGVISGRNFDLQDTMLSTRPYACIAVIDLPISRTSYLQSPGGKVAGQIEVRVISKASEVAAKTLAGYVNTLIFTTLNAIKIYQVPDTDETMQTWHEILTVDYKT
jgi:hypothetical protein